jgi:YVTN family beta-propeller protein
VDHVRVATSAASAREPAHHRFRLAVVIASVVAAAIGSVALATRDSGGTTTTRGITATLRIPGHPGWVAADRNTLWLALSDTETRARDRALLRLDLASGKIDQRILVGGRATYLLHAGKRLFASVEHVGDSGFGPSLIVALGWRSGRILARKPFPTPVGQLAESVNDLWALQVKPAALLRLDPRTLLPKAAPLSLSDGQVLGLASGAGYVWATASDRGEVLRIDPASRAVTPVKVGGYPVGVTVAAGSVWFVDRDRGLVGRLRPRTLEPVGRPIHLGGAPAWLARTGHHLLVGDAEGGIVSRIDARSGEVVGRPIRVAAPAKPEPALAVAPAGNSVWVSSFASSTLTRVSAASTTSEPPAVIASSGRTTVAKAGRLPRGGTIAARVRLGRGAPAPLGGGALNVGLGAVWAMSDIGPTLMRIDPARNAVVARIKLPSPPESIAVGDGAVWLSYPSNDTVSRIDARTNKVTATIHVGPQPAGIAVSPGTVWVANTGSPSVSRIDPGRNRVVATIRVGAKVACCFEHMSLAAVPGALWVAVPNGNKIVRVDPATNRIVESVKLPYSPCGYLVADASSVWSAGGGCADVVGRIDPGSRKLTAKLSGPHPVGLALASGSVWAAVIDSADVDRIDPHTGRLIARLHVGGAPVRLAVGFGSVWVNDDDGRVLRIRPAS